MKLDDIKIYLSGAPSDGGAQTDPDLALGNYRSSTEMVNKKDAVAPTNCTGVTINYASIANADGNGTLDFTYNGGTGQTLQWTPLGGSIGAAVDVDVDDTYLIYSADTSKFISVTTVSASFPGGNATDADITISDTSGLINNIFDNVASAEASSGENEYRCVFVKNEHVSETLNAAAVYISAETPATGDSIDIAVEPPSAQPAGFVQTIADEDTPPTAITFNHAITEGTAVSIGNLAPGEIYGVWLKRIVIASAGAFNDNNFELIVLGGISNLEN
jgi:hypothetical protein